MIISRGPLIKFFVVLWCMFGYCIASVDAFLFQQHFSHDIIVSVVEEQPEIDRGIQTGTAEIRKPCLFKYGCAVALRNYLKLDKQINRPVKRTAKPHRISHIEYCPRKMVRSIMLQFHPHIV